MLIKPRQTLILFLTNSNHENQKSPKWIKVSFSMAFQIIIIKKQSKWKSLWESIVVKWFNSIIPNRTVPNGKIDSK